MATPKTPSLKKDAALRAFIKRDAAEFKRLRELKNKVILDRKKREATKK